MVRLLVGSTLLSAVLAADQCDLYAIDGDTCNQSTLRCDYTKYAKLAQPELQDGNCADQGYTVKGDETTKSYPVIGDITITKYTKATLTADMCDLYAIDGDTCGQSTLNCDYTKYAKLAQPELQDGNCADQGFTVKGDTQTKSYPVIGDIIITTYTKSALTADMCDLYAIDGDTCGQSTLNCDYTKYAKLAQPELQDGNCADQGFTVKGDTQTKSYPVIGDIIITTYTKASLTADTCDLYAIDGDTCNQSTLRCDYTKYAKLAQPELQDGNCADQGYTVKGDETTKSYPVIGDITITKYTKSALMMV